jgi:hypothetical protein
MSKYEYFQGIIEAIRDGTAKFAGLAPAQIIIAKKAVSVEKELGFEPKNVFLFRKNEAGKIEQWECALNEKLNRKSIMVQWFNEKWLPIE